VRERLDHLVQEMFDRGIRLEDAVREVERRFIALALDASDGHIGDAAARLGLHRNTLSRKVAEYKLR
jgi:Fis family transcriptional regulator, factor for inversion stimulation protein